MKKLDELAHLLANPVLQASFMLSTVQLHFIGSSAIGFFSSN
jgi:hypothetical protein